VEYLQANKGAAEYLVVASNAMSASPIILNTDEPVISLGGYNGIDPVFTAGDLSNLVDRGALRFFLMPDRERMEEMRAERESGQQGAPQAPLPGGPPGMDNESASWVQDNCEKVPQEEWQSSDSEQQSGGSRPMMRAQALYDCGT
jgi:hypothetical protein